VQAKGDAIVPKPAQDRLQRGPLAALLILLGLFLGSGTATANVAGLAAPAARSAQGRQGSASALLQSSLRATLDDEAADGGTPPPILASAPSLVSETGWTRPLAHSPAETAVPRSLRGAFFYRARAPPAA
jgi:hypothetical protein